MDFMQIADSNTTWITHIFGLYFGTYDKVLALNWVNHLGTGLLYYTSKVVTDMLFKDVEMLFFSLN